MNKQIAGPAAAAAGDAVEEAGVPAVLSIRSTFVLKQAYYSAILNEGLGVIRHHPKYACVSDHS